MDINIVLQAISTIGFPMAVAVWFMAVGHKDSKNNTDALNHMANAVDNNTKTIERLHAEGYERGI